MKNSFKGLRVLIVEDDAGLLETLQFEFKFFGCEVKTAQNGAEALELFKSQPFDFIASDVRMPICDGIKFLEEVRAIAKVYPPFVFLTGFSEYNLWDIFHRGADMMLQKPISPKQLMEMLKTLVQTNEKRWQQKPDDRPTVTISLKDPFVASDTYELGRSGFFIAGQLVNNFSEVVPGHLVAFNSISSPDRDCLNGYGKVVWKRNQSEGKLPAGCGVEFVYIEESDRPKLLSYLKSHQLQKVIPNGINNLS